MQTGEAGSDPRTGRRPRIAFLSFSSAVYDARTARMARTAIRAGYDVVVYARSQAGLPDREERDGYVVHRLPWRASLAIPGVARLSRGARPTTAATAPVPAPSSAPSAPASPSSPRRRRGLAGLADLVLQFPVRPIAWSRSLDAVTQPADVWHGMWAGSLPALVRLSGRLGGGTVYDSRDVYLQSRGFAVAPAPVRRLLGWFERRWARRVGAVLTVNAWCATLLETQLRVARPGIIPNVPERWSPPVPAPDRIRAALGLPPTTDVVLYQGQLIPERGIEPAIEAIRALDGVALVLLGWGPLRAGLEARARTADLAGRLFLLPPVPPAELLEWTASADVSVMAIQPTTPNHRYATPQKLLESLAAGVPVVASDLPAMAEVVTDADAGVLCDPTSPASIADGIRTILAATPGERAARRARILAAAHERYAWEAQEPVLLATWERVRTPS